MSARDTELLESIASNIATAVTLLALRVILKHLIKLGILSLQIRNCPIPFMLNKSKT
jgi:hypothetical protein